MKAVIKLDVPEWQIGTEVSVYFKDTMMQKGICEAIEEKKHFKMDVPDKCKNCTSCYILPTATFYCGMAGNDRTNIISIGIEDTNKRPDWCPVQKLNESLEKMNEEERDKFDKLAESMAAIFGERSIVKK